MRRMATATGAQLLATIDGEDEVEESTAAAGGSGNTEQASSTNNISAAAAVDATTSYNVDAQEPAQKEERTTTAYTNFIAHHPYLMILLCILCTLIMTVLWLFVVDTGTQKKGASGGQFLAIGNTDVKRYLAQLQSEKRTSTLTQPVQILTDEKMQLVVFFELIGGGNIFTPQYLQEMYRVEQQIIGQRTRGSVTVNGYAENCQLEYLAHANGSVITPAVGCVTPFSPLSQIFFRGVAYNSTLVDALTQADIDAILAQLSDPAITAALGLEFFFSTDFYSRGNKSAITRAVFTFGVPLSLRKADGARKYLFYNTDNDVDQWLDHTDWVAQYTDFFAARDTAYAKSDMELFYMEELLSNKEIGDLVQTDLNFVVAAIFGVYALMILFTGSLFYATAGLLNIVMSYPISMALFHGLLQIQISTLLNQMALFIIIGIGADDIFVFVDAWKQSAQESEEYVGTLERRLYWSWHRAAMAMIVTSATTFFAFLMTATSPIPTISTFGIVAALLVFSMYCLVISFYPACVVIGHRWNIDSFSWSDKCCPCRSNKVPRGLDQNKNKDKALEMTTPSRVDVCANNGAVRQNKRVAGTPEASVNAQPQVSRRKSVAYDEDVSELVQDYRCCERVYYERYTPFLYQWRYVFLAVFFVLYILAIVGTAYLQTPTEIKSELPAGTEFGKALDRLEFFPVSGGIEALSFKSYMYMGIETDNPVDRGGIDKNDEDRFGSLNLNPGFVLNNATMHWIDAVCKRLRSATDLQGGRLVLQGEMRCFTDSLIPYINGLSLTSAVFASDASIANTVRNFINAVDSSGEQTNLIYLSDIGGIEDPNPERVTWIRLAAILPLDSTPTSPEMDDAYDSWTKETNDINGVRPVHQTKFMTASVVWAWRATFGLLVSDTYISILTQFCVAVGVLMLTSRNYIVAGFASLTIAGIVFSVLAVFVAAGSKLDFIEAVVALMLVGLSVDYVVHFAHAFNETHLPHRFARTRSALLEMGISVTEGALTTLLAAFFLLFTVFPFFQTFGKFVFATICLSYVWSNGFFMACLITYGPHRHPTGDIGPLVMPLYRKLKSSICGTNDEEG